MKFADELRKEHVKASSAAIVQPDPNEINNMAHYIVEKIKKQLSHDVKNGRVMKTKATLFKPSTSYAVGGVTILYQKGFVGRRCGWYYSDYSGDDIFNVKDKSTLRELVGVIKSLCQKDGIQVTWEDRITEAGIGFRVEL